MIDGVVTPAQVFEDLVTAIGNFLRYQKVLDGEHEHLEGNDENQIFLNKMDYLKDLVLEAPMEIDCSLCAGSELHPHFKWSLPPDVDGIYAEWCRRLAGPGGVIWKSYGGKEGGPDA